MRTVRLLRNAWRCSECGDVVESVAEHEMVACGCGDLHVDGGRQYARFMMKRGFPQPRVFTIEHAESLWDPVSRQALCDWLEDLGHGNLDPDRPLDLVHPLLFDPPVDGRIRASMMRQLSTAELHPCYQRAKP